MKEKYPFGVHTLLNPKNVSKEAILARSRRKRTHEKKLLETDFESLCYDRKKKKNLNRTRT